MSPTEDVQANVSIQMTLTASGGDMGDDLTEALTDNVLALPHTAEFTVDFGFDLSWNRS